MNTDIVVVDFDETLALYEGITTAGVNIPKAKPNVPLINKLNSLYENGYEIHIYTARGHFSTDSREEADEKYRKVIQDWLEEHNVKHNVLSFKKPFAVYYVDDKAIRPNELSKLDELIK